MDSSEAPQHSARPDFIVRKGTVSDEGFVAKSWVDTARGSSRQTRNIDAGSFNAFHYSMAKRILERAEIRIAAPPDDESTIYGFAVLEPGVVHIVYTKKAWRRLGIASELVRGVGATDACFSTWSQDCTNWISDKYKGMRYAPYWMTSNG